MSTSPTWEFAIDVGGTFTDCLAYAPDGRTLRHKLLSSGIVKGAVGPGSTNNCVIDINRVGDPPDFWTGFRLTFLDKFGASVAEATVESFDEQTGRLFFSQSLAEMPSLGMPYELSCDLEAPVIAIRYLLGIPLAAEVPPTRLRLGTTRGTNALLTRTGARTALVTTCGFADLLEIGYQDRPDLFALTVRKPKPLVETSIEIQARISAKGDELIPLEQATVAKQLEQLRRLGIESLAICLLHADLYPDHERQVAAIAKAIGFEEISCSSEVAPLIKVVARAETTVVDAYLRPVLKDYLARLQNSLPASSIRLMTSAGGLVVPEAFRGHESVLSGPAGGVVGYAKVAAAAGFERAIGFDMGGTSTDVSRFDGAYEFEYESRKASARLMAPTLAIETVAAGGGSICHFDGVKLTVGPDSAGAEPGPACYGRGGPLTVTDLNVYLGRIAEERFPFTLNHNAVESQLQKIALAVSKANGQLMTPVQLAEGLLRIANANMASAVRGISISKGANPSDYVMVAFGGAAAQHACAVASELGIQQVLIHPDAGILSAFGIGHADVVRHAVRGMAVSIDEICSESLAEEFKQLAIEPVEQVAAAGIDPKQIEVRRSLDVRYVGTDEAINIPFVNAAEIKGRFEQQHETQFGYVHHERTIEVVAARVQAIGKVDRRLAKSTSCPSCECEPTRQTRFHFRGAVTTASVYDRANLPLGARLNGPSIIADEHSTIVIEPGWRAERLSGGDLLLTVDGLAEENSANELAADAVLLEVFNNLLASIAEQMGHVLRRTASSVNVKERLDYSCALFTAAGELIANAPHVPVHLGAMGATVRAISAERPKMFVGDVYVTNDPYCGGSHLPDITVVTPVHDLESEELLFFTACRAHHAEIGGIRPGSMPPKSKNLAEEGVLISNFALVENGVNHEADLRQLLTSGPHPSRRVEENMADIRAQVAANRQGASDLLALVQRYSLPVVATQIKNIQQAAESKVRTALERFTQQTCEFTDYLETADGTSIPICAQLTFGSAANQPAVTIDFTGSAPVVAGNLNANQAIVTAAVLYVLRLLVAEDIPLNEGALRAVDIVLPPGLLNPPVGDSPATTPAVVAGNVETSQRVVDVLLGALGIAASSQGTMNNLLFGNDSFGYYETICGGSGATADGPGADAVQVHMTNTRATDPEILERRLPVRLVEFSIRPDSGGAGKHRGGNGVVRRLEFLQPLEVSLITQRRGPHAPSGADGGMPGKLGENHLVHEDGTRELLTGICEFDANPGDELIIKTPGGGGFGKA